ncbi:MAG: response regulator [Chloroflexi bacterium]|nr:response regulator [Chloroflexota bacterium]
MIGSGKVNVDAPTVLVVDDNPENRILLTSQLGLEGYHMIQANGGRDGLTMARTHDPDIILLDVMMPDMNGFEVCRALKADPQTHLIPIIMVTALREVEARIEGKKAGADEFLSRPHVREELLVRVRTLIQLKRARVNLEEQRNRFKLLYDISRATSTQLNMESMMADIIIETQKAVGATKGNIMLLDDNGEVNHKFLVRAGSQLEISDNVTQDVMTKGLGGWLLQHKQGDIIEDITKDDRWITLPDDRLETGSAIGVPLSSLAQTVGVLILNHPDTNYFTQAHLELLEVIGNTVTNAINNANLFIEISEERRKLEAILAQSTDAIITTDESWHVALINHAAEELFNLQATDVVNQSVQDIPQLHTLIPIFEGVGGYENSHEVKLDDGHILYSTVSPIQNVGYAAVLQDITELKRVEELKLEREREEKQRVKETFSRYMGPSLVEHVLKNVPNLMARRERRQAVVMFADIRDFTRFTRLNEPDVVIERINKFFTKMAEVVYDFEGTIFELTGDEILVGFNAPFDQEDAATRALQTAVAMHQRFNTLREHLFSGLSTGFGMGVGIDQGEVVVGNVGAETRMTFRMVGDATNTAHRLVDLARDGQIVISTRIFNSIDQKAKLLNGITLESRGPVSIKGKDVPQIVYQAAIFESK